MIEYSIWLSLVNGLSKKKKAMLLEKLGSAEVIYSSYASVIMEALPKGTSPQEVEGLWDKSMREVKNILEACSKCRATPIDYLDDRYPAMLRTIPDPPTVLYVRGNLPDLTGVPAVAIVGQRKATVSGLANASQIAYDLARNGVAVISGMAAGVDGAAHRGAIDGGGLTVAVLGTPIDKCYPFEHRGLMREIISSGAVVSEYPPGSQTHKGSFISRNRIISGMSNGVLVVEAKNKSGSLVTAARAIEQNRDVYAIPGPIDIDDHMGTNQLIREGAALVTSAADILSELKMRVKAPAKSRSLPKQTEYREGSYISDLFRPNSIIEYESYETGNHAAGSYEPVIQHIPEPEPAVDDRDPQDRAVLEAIGKISHLDAIVERTGMDVGDVLARLTMLEIMGEVAQRPGNYYERTR